MLERLRKRSVGIILILASLVVIGSIIALAQRRSGVEQKTRPRTVTSTNQGTSQGNSSSIRISPKDDLQKAISLAKCGDTIILTAGATYAAPSGGSFGLPDKPQCGAQGEFITITTSNIAGLPEGKRVSPDNASAMAKVVTVSSTPAVYVNHSAHHYRFVGIEFTNVVASGQHVPNLVLGGDYATYEQTPHHIEFDRCFLHPIEETTNPSSPLRSVSHAISLNAKHVKLTNSYLSGFMGRYNTDPNQNIDSMGLVITSAPFLIENNYISAWYNNILIGGTDPPAPPSNQAKVIDVATLTSATLSQTANLSVGDLISFQQPAGENANGQVLTKNGNSITFTPLQVNNNGGNSLKNGVAPAKGADAQWNGELPADIQVKYNTFDKPIAWKALMGGNQPKAWIEIKLAAGLLIEGNVFKGYPSVVGSSVKNQSGGAPWSTVRDVTITNNRFDSFSYPFIFNLKDELRVSTEGGNIIIANNLCTGARGSEDYGIASKFVQLAGGTNVQIYHNTCFQQGDIISGSPVTKSFVFRDNLVNYGTYGMNCMVPGGFRSCWPGMKMSNNMIVDTREDRSANLADYYPAGNYFLSTLNQAAFADAAHGDFRLNSNSRYKGKASDGTDPGVDMDALNKALAQGN